MKESIRHFKTRYKHCKVFVSEGQPSGAALSRLPLFEASLL